MWNNVFFKVIKLKLITRVFFIYILSIYSHFCISAENPSDKIINKPMQELLSTLAGTWVSDVEYIEEYFQKAVEIQKLWCGYGWPKEEIKKRANIVRDEVANKGPASTFMFRNLGNESLELDVKGQNKRLTSSIISECKKLKNDLVSCKQNPAVLNRPFAFKVDGKYFYSLFKMTPQVMKCEIKSHIPREAWISIMRFIRVNTEIGE